MALTQTPYDTSDFWKKGVIVVEFNEDSQSWGIDQLIGDGRYPLDYHEGSRFQRDKVLEAARVHAASRNNRPIYINADAVSPVK